MTRWSWRGVAKRSREVLREQGPRSLWFKLLGETVYRRMDLFERQLDQPILQRTARVPVVIEVMSLADVDEYLAFRPGADRAEVRRRLDAGQWCFVARHQGRMVHACWAAAGPVWIAYLGRDMELGSDEAYVYDGFTLPDYRNEDIAGQRYGHMLRFLREAGFRRTFAAAMPENTVAYRPIEKAGYRSVGMIGYVKLGPWRRDFRRAKGTAPLPGLMRKGYGPTYWDAVVGARTKKPHYMDEFLGALKRDAYLALIGRWAGDLPFRAVLKTDLFEEAMGPDAFLLDLCDGACAPVGMDISVTAARAALARDAARRGRYVVADVRRLPFAGQSFPVVVSPSTLDHFSDANDLGIALRELHRVLEPGGRLIITLDNRQNVFDPLLRLAIRLGRTPFHIGRSYSVAGLRGELEAAGFRVLETTAILHNPRLMAVLTTSAARRLGWRPLTRLVRGGLRAAQGLERTRLRYRTGSFVAALAIREGTEARP